jgi:hypothetical protein
MGCACFKQEVAVSKNVKPSKSNIDEGNRNININIRIEQRENNIPEVINYQLPNNNPVRNNNIERVSQNRAIRNHNRASDNINQGIPNEPYLQSKNNPNFNMTEVGKIF